METEGIYLNKKQLKDLISGETAVIETIKNHFKKMDSDYLHTPDQKINPKDILRLKKKYDISTAEIAHIIGLRGSDSSRTVRRWIAPKENQGFRQIPWYAWELLCLKLGEDPYRF